MLKMGRLTTCGEQFRMQIGPRRAQSEQVEVVGVTDAVLVVEHRVHTGSGVVYLWDTDR